jgi:hypothetical protein
MSSMAKAAARLMKPNPGTISLNAHALEVAEQLAARKLKTEQP